MHGEKKQHKHGSSKKQAKKEEKGGLERGEWDCNQKRSQFVCLVCHGTPQNQLLPFCVFSHLFADGFWCLGL